MLMLTLPVNSTFASLDWTDTLRSHVRIKLPANSQLEVTGVDEQLCKDAIALQAQWLDPTLVMTYLFQSAIVPFESKLSISSTQEPQLDIQPEKRTYSIMAKTALTITMATVLLTIRAVGEMLGEITLKPNEILIITDIASEPFSDPVRKHLSCLKEEMDKRAPKNHEYEIVSAGKIDFVKLSSGYPGGVSIRSNAPLTLRQVRKVEVAPLPAESHSLLPTSVVDK